MKPIIGAKISSHLGYAQATVIDHCDNGDIVAETEAGAIVTLSPNQYKVIEANPFKQKITADDFKFLRAMQIKI